MTDERNASSEDPWSFLRLPEAVAEDLLRNANPAAQERVEAAKRRAKAVGIDLDTLLAEDEERIASGEVFPSPACLTPGEVERYWAEEITLPVDRQSHVDSCGFCQRVLGAAEPTLEQLERFLDELGSLPARVNARRGTAAGAGA